MAGFRPRVPFYDSISRYGLTSGLKLCLDAGDALSYPGSGQKWLDRSGGGYDFFLGADVTATTDDPTFNGAAGGLNTGEYFSFDGGDKFRYDTTNETWMQNIHRDGAKVTIMAWAYFVGNPSQVVVGNDQNTQFLIGFNMRKTGGNALGFIVKNATADAALTVQAGTVPLSTWTFLAASSDESVGANGGFLYIDGNVILTFNSTYTAPNAGNAASTLEVGAAGNGAVAFQSGSRIAFLAIWEGVTPLTSTQVGLIYNATHSFVKNPSPFQYMMVR